MDRFIRLMRDHSAEVAAAGVFALLAAIGAPALQETVARASDAVRIEALSALERASGRCIDYSRVSPSVFLYFDIRDLRLASRGDKSERTVHIARLRVHYSLLRLLLGRSPLAAVTRVDIRDTSLDLGALGGPASAGTSGRHVDALAALPPTVEISGTNLTASFVSLGADVRLQRLFFRARRAGDQMIIHSSRAAVAVTHPSLTFRAHLRFAGRLAPDLSTVDAVLRVDGLRTETFALSRQAFQIQRDAGSLELRRIRDKAPIDLLLAVDRSRARLAVRTQRYSPRALVSFVGPLAFANEYTRASVTVDAVAEYSFASATLRYRMALEAQIGGRLLPPGTAVQARVDGDEQLMRLAPLAVTSSRGDLRFEGDLALADLLPEGLLSLSDLAAFADKRVDAELDLRRGERSVVLSGRRFEIAGTAFDDMRLAITLKPGELVLDFRADFGRQLRRTLVASGVLRSRPTPRLRAALRMQSLPLSSVVRFAPLPADRLRTLEVALADLLLDGDVEMETDFRALRLEAQTLSVSHAAEPGNSASFSLLGDAGRLAVSDARVTWGGQSLRGSLVLKPGPLSTDFEATVLLKDMAYAVEGTWDPSLGLEMRGSYGLHLAAQAFGKKYFFSLSAAELPLPLEGPGHRSPRLTVDLEGSWEDAGSWSLRVMHLALRDLPWGAGGSSSLETRLSASPRLVNLERLSFRDRLGEIATVRPASFALGEALSGSLELAANGGLERYSVKVDLGSRSFEAELRLMESPLARLSPDAIAGRVSGLIQASGSYGDPTVAASLRLSQAALGGQPVAAAIEAVYRQRRLTVSGLRGELYSYRVGSTAAWYELDSGRFQVETSLTGRHAAAVVASRVRLEGVIRPGPGVPLWKALFRGELRGLAAIADPQGDRDAAYSWILTFVRTGEVIAFQGGPADSIRGRLFEDGTFEVTLSPPLPLRGRAVGTLVGESPELRISGLEIDLPWLSSLSGTDFFSFVTGTAYGIGDVTLAGPLVDPLWAGRLEARNVRMGFYMTPDLTSQFNAEILLRDRDLVLEPARARVGPAELSANGAIGFARWTPSSYDLQFQTGGSAGVRTVHDFGTVAVDGYATGFIRVRGNDLAVHVTGDLQVDHCKLTLSGTPEGRTKASAEHTAPFVDLRLTAGRRVEFAWPSINFPVLRASVRTGSRLRIEHAGDSLQTRVSGRAALRGGDVFYINRSFYIKEGELAFNESEQRFDPRLSLRGEIRERDRTGRDVRIYLVVEDRRLSEFSPRFESDPPRSDIEIIGLLGGPIEEQLVQSGLAGSAVLVSSDIISHFGLLRPFEQGVRDLLGLDLFSIRTQMIQNVVVDRVLGLEPPVLQPTVDPLGRYFANTTMTFGKYIGKDLFLEMDVRLTEKSTAGVDTEVQFSLDWPTPLFDLEWVMSPGGGNVESFVREKTRLNITWRYTY